MDDNKYSTSMQTIDFLSSSPLKFEKLIHIPITTKIIDSLINLFNYLDIYGPKMPLVYSIVSVIRIFQLVGGAFMSANTNVFKQKSLAWYVMSKMTFFFHILPVEVRRRKAWIIQLSIDIILLIMAIYLIVTAFSYKSTSKVPAISTFLLTVFMAIGPFLLLPVAVQFQGQNVAGQISGKSYRDFKNIGADVFTFLMVILWLWIIIAAFTKNIVFRPCSLASVQGKPQTRLILTSTAVTFITGFTTYSSKYVSVIGLALCVFIYIYGATTVFGCGTFIKESHQTLVLTGCFAGMILCAVNIYPLLYPHPWGMEFFAIFAGIFLVLWIGSYLFLKSRSRKDLIILDEIEETEDITIIKPNKFKQMCVPGYTYAHPLCVSFKFFKLAIQEWTNEIEIFCMYTKFLAVYPEQESQLALICSHIAQMKKTNETLQRSTLASAAHILKTRETKLTPDLKSQIAKLQKLFMKTKNKVRNFWDLVLQGNVNEMHQAVQHAKPLVEECGVEMSFLMMQYPSNRFVLRQYIIFCKTVRCDPIESNKAIENLKKLNRGIEIIPDNVHALGMAAFPNLPEYSITTTESLNEIKTMDSENWGTEENLAVDDLNIEALEALNKQVRNHKVPAITFIVSSTIICYLSLVIVPLAALMIYFSFFKAEMKEPIIITEGIAKTSVTLAVLSGYAGRIFFRKLDDPHNTGHPIMDPLDFDYKFNFNAFGGNSKDIDILKYCTTQIPVSNAAISQIRKFKPNNPYMNQIRNLLFTNSINFTLYFNKTDYVKRLSSVTEITYMVSNHIGKFYDWGAGEGQMWTVENLLSSDSLTARHNMDGSLRAMGQSLDLMYVYYDNFKNTYILAFKITIMVLSAICIIAYFTIYYVQLEKLRKNRYEILYILTTLPKTMISNISASFSKVNNAGDSVKTETDADVNRQEESIVKLFGSITDGAGASSEMAAFMVFSLMISICCVSYYTILSDYIDLTEKVVGKSSHIYHLYGCAAYLYAVMGAIFKIALCTYDTIFENAVVNLTAEINKYQERIPLVIDHFNALALGSPEQGPFEGLQEIIVYATKAIYCYSKEIPPPNFLRSVHCFSAPQQFELVIALLKRFESEMTQKTPIYPDPSEKTLSQLWQVGPVELYEVFFFKAGNEIVPLLSQRIDDMHKKIILSGILYMCAELLLTGVVLLAAKQENDFLKFSLKAFLRCPPIMIFSNHRVMNLLCGTYSTRIDDMGERHATYYEEVVNKLDDIVIVASDETRKIYNVNSAFVNMFGIEKNEIENAPFDEFLARVNFQSEDEVSKIFSSLIHVTYKNAKGETVYLEFTSVSVSGRRIIYATNQTQNVLHEKLIAEEKLKSDRMLSSILPPSMVPRVQAGEKNISFAVQSVSVLFLDIVSFTPWCGSHDAQYVMRMLNLMFKRLDALTAMHKTMTKIKCIGDCYMTAGGIFDEVNQPAVHAKEVVDFGRGAIQTIFDIDQQENEKLQIRVGVNTGGPIVTGVIGTEKPTFEILGPAINIAHEMEHHGVPMKVHISRPVYELIYGQQFEIKERGEIDVKGSKMFTYLVEP